MNTVLEHTAGDTVTEEIRVTGLAPVPQAAPETHEDVVPFGRTQIIQGDVMLDLVPTLPATQVALEAVDGLITLMPPSEGRPLGSHTIDATAGVQAFAAAGETLPAYLQVSTVARLEHAPKEGETHHHGTVSLTQGIWRVRRQREHVPSAASMPVVNVRAAAD